MNLHNVAFAVQPKPFGPDGQGSQESDSFHDVVTRQVRVLVNNVTAIGVLIGGAPALDEFQRRPARAIEVVVEEREGKLFSTF